MKIIDEFKTHHYWNEWTKEDKMYCPTCGNKGTLWSDNGEGDYYYGPTSICTMCCNSFNLHGGGSMITSDNYIKILTQLINEKTAEPTTPKGN